MKQKVLFLFLSLFVSVEVTIAERVQIGSLFYNLNMSAHTAQVTYHKQYSSYNYPSLTTIAIPKSVEYNSVTYIVTGIERESFAHCPGLKSVTTSSCTTSIGAWSFSRCSALSSIILSNNVKYIEDGAFELCTALSSITIPNGVISIGNMAFYNCSGLTDVAIGNCVKSIGEGAFIWCSNLTSIICTATTPPICKDSAFKGVNKTICTLYVPKECVNSYKTADGWKDFTNIIAISETSTKVNY